MHISDPINNSITIVEEALSNPTHGFSSMSNSKMLLKKKYYMKSS